MLILTQLLCGRLVLLLLGGCLCPAVLRSRSRKVQSISAQAAAAGGTPVPKNSILVVGGTGTLGRQVVRKALDEGYEVRCIVKPRQNPADFLRDWGATTVQVRLRAAAADNRGLAAGLSIEHSSRGVEC